MRKYLKESLHWLHLALFKPVTLASEASELGAWRELYLKVLPVQLVITFGIVALVGLVSESTGNPFHWSKGILGVIIAGLGGALVGGSVGASIEESVGALVFGTSAGAAGGLVVGLGVGLVVGLVVGAVGALSGGLFFALFGLFLGLFLGLFFGLVGQALGGLASWLVGGLVIGLFIGGLAQGIPGYANASLTEVPIYGIAYSSGFLVVYLRPVYLLPYALQVWRSKRAADPFPFFRNSPIYWDEAMAMPLPRLTDWLVNLARFDRSRGLSEIANVARLPHQRRAAQRALVTVLLQDLEQTGSFESVASALRLFGILPSAAAEDLPAGLNDAVRHIGRVAELASDYQTRVTTVGQMKVLEELGSAIESFRDAMVLIRPPVGPAFQAAASRWLEIVKAEEAECRKRMAFEPIPNPYVVGNPLVVRDHSLFKGRKDIIVAIEDNIINPNQRPALLLYGRRRIGKTSTLLNLPRLLSSRFVPVFIDCQDAKWREGDEAFCYHVAVSIHDALNQRSLVETAKRPQLERFERYAFTRLGEYLDQVEESSRAAHKQILLTFDEYERLEAGIRASKLTTEVLNQLRTIVQHRERIVVLFSGGHRFEEMRAINWSDYLINVKTLELTFLAPEDARELITEPVPLLQYESGVIEQIIEMTHCQPYLLQAVASDLVNYLNSEGRMLATETDLEVAVEKVLVTAQSYFYYTWTGDCSEAEREVLRMIATGNANSRTLAERQSSLQSLCHKEILERQASGYRFSIELFRRWVLKNQTAQPFTPGDLPEPAEFEHVAS